MRDSHKNINACLEAAQDQRSRFIMVLPPEVTGIKDLYASLDRFDENYLYLEASSLKEINPKWILQPVICYFKLITKKEGKRESFLNFNSTIIEIAKNRNGIIELKVEYPKKLKVGQRRSNIRVEMEDEYVVGFYLWEGKKFIKDSRDKKSLNKPVLSMNEIKSGQVRIMDISAGGIKIRVKTKMISNQDVDIERGALLIFWISLYNPDTSGNESYWIKGRIQYIYEDFITKSIDIGIQFISTATITEEKVMKWNLVRHNHVEAIGNWAFRRYLEQYRKGLI